MSNNNAELDNLCSEIKKLRKEILMLKIKQAYDNFNDVSQFKKRKKEIARLMTKLNSLVQN
jgi:ribosomal protein L29